MISRGDLLRHFGQAPRQEHRPRLERELDRLAERESDEVMFKPHCPVIHSAYVESDWDPSGYGDWMVHP